MSDEAGIERTKRFAVAVVILFLILIGRLWHMQVVQGDDFREMAEGNRLRTIPIRAPRGMIYDRDGELLVANRLAFTVSAVPFGLVDPEGKVVDYLSELLGMEAEEIRKLLAQGGGRPYVPTRLKRDVPIETVVAVEENRTRLPGVMVEEEWVREYPHGDIAGHILGYLGAADARDVQAGYAPTDLVGKAGLELAYERYLRGTDGVRRVEVNALSRPIRDLGVVPPTPGLDLYLTIDLDLQRSVTEILSEGIRQLAIADGDPLAGGGAAVVLDPRTGEILAMVSHPTIDLARLTGEDRSRYVAELNANPHSPWLNRALRAFPPGSTFKVVTGLAALESGAIEPDTVYNATGYHKYNKRDWTIHLGLPPAGPVTIVQALARSTNDFFWEISLRPETGGIRAIGEWARRLGLGSVTGLNLPGGAEMPGLVPDPEWKRAQYGEPWYEAETMDVAIGQGFLQATPLQVAQLYATIAMRGVMMQPHLVTRAAAPDGGVAFAVRREVKRIVDADPSTWDAIVEGLRAVTQWQRGTAYSAFRGAAYDPAGKTGSAQTGRESHGWFAGFAPASDPEIVVVVFAEYGGSGAEFAHIARRIMDVYFKVGQEDVAFAEAKEN